MTRIVPIVLAAGASSRLGVPKGLADFDGQTTLGLVLEAISDLRRPIVVLGEDRDRVLSRVALDEAHVVTNDDATSGMSGSLRVALAELPVSAEGFLIFPVDHPLVTRKEVAVLVETFHRHPSPGRMIFVPRFGERRGHPVLCERSLAPEFEALAADEPLHRVIRRVPERVVSVPVDSDVVLLDMDTPEDHRRCLAAYRARRSQ